MFSSDFNLLARPIVAMQNNKGPSGSPCCIPSAELIMKSPKDNKETSS